MIVCSMSYGVGNTRQGWQCDGSGENQRTKHHGLGAAKLHLSNPQKLPLSHIVTTYKCSGAIKVFARVITHGFELKKITTFVPESRLLAKLFANLHPNNQCPAGFHSQRITSFKKCKIHKTVGKLYKICDMWSIAFIVCVIWWKWLACFHVATNSLRSGLLPWRCTEACASRRSAILLPVMHDGNRSIVKTKLKSVAETKGNLGQM